MPNRTTAILATPARGSEEPIVEDFL